MLSKIFTFLSVGISLVAIALSFGTFFLINGDKGMALAILPRTMEIGYLMVFALIVWIAFDLRSTRRTRC